MNRVPRGTSRATLAIILSAAAFGGVAWAMIAGAPAERWRPVASFLGVCVLSAISMRVSGAVMKRRIRTRGNRSVPFGVHLRQPMWVWLTTWSFLVALGAATAALAAAIGFPGVGLGLLLAVMGFCLGTYALSRLGVTITGVMFEASGLRVQMRGATFTAPWTAITRVEGAESPANSSLLVKIGDLDSAFRFLKPDTPEARLRVKVAALDSEGRLRLDPESLGFDRSVFASAILAAMEPKSIIGN